MADEGYIRKLTAILGADVKGYSSLMDDDEEATLRTLTSHRDAITDLIEEYRGRVVDTPGDYVLAEFPSVVDAVSCAVEIQRELAERNEELPDNRKMAFRIGINLGDVIEKDGKIYGDGVNIAARIEPLADAGGICISGTAHDHVANKLDLEFEFLGEHEVKNISTPVRVYRVLSHPGAAAHRVVRAKWAATRRWRGKAFGASMIALAAIVALVFWQVYEHSNKEEPSLALKAGTVYPTADKPSIVVLPFENMTGDPEQQYFSDGLTEQIITGLSQGPHVYVTSRVSSFAFKGKDMKSTEIAEELGVQYLLEGSVQRRDDRIRINVQLIDGATGNHVWAENYDYKSDDLFALQDDITMKVMGAVGVNTAGFQSTAYFKNVRPTNQDAYEYYLKAYYIHLGRKTKEISQAIEAIEKAIQFDPEFAPAHLLSGFIYLDLITRGVTKTPEEVMQKAILAAERAEELAPDYPPNILWSHIYRIKKDYDKAVSYAEKAIQQAPNRPYFYYFLSLAHFLGFNDFEAAKEAMEKGLQLIPFRPVNFLQTLAWSHICLEEYDEGISLCNEVIERAPESFFAYNCHKGLLLAYEWSGNHAKAVEAAENVVRMNPKYSLEIDKKRSPVKEGELKDKVFATYQKVGLPK